MKFTNKKGFEYSLKTIIEIVLVLVVIFFAGVIIYNIPKLVQKSAASTEPPCIETGKTIDETEKILFDYFQMNIGEKSHIKKICESYKRCFPAYYSKYKTECEDLKV